VNSTTAIERSIALTRARADRLDLLGHIDGELDDPRHCHALIQHRVVGCLQPDHPARLVTALEAPAKILAGPQVGPELLVNRGAHVVGLAQGRVLLAHQRPGRKAHDGAEVVVGGQHDALRAQFNHRRRAVQGTPDGKLLCALRLKLRHPLLPLSTKHLYSLAQRRTPSGPGRI
jgi:hypothetical protein